MKAIIAKLTFSRQRRNKRGIDACQEVHDNRGGGGGGGGKGVCNINLVGELVPKRISKPPLK